MLLFKSRLLVLKLVIMGWNKRIKRSRKVKEGLKVGCWNKGGALQPLHEKINEIENLIKNKSFDIFGVLEANLFENNCTSESYIEGYNIYWDKGRNNCHRRNSRSVLFVRKDLNQKIRKDLMDDSVPEVWLEVGEPGKKRSLVCLFYRECSQLMKSNLRAIQCDALNDCIQS